MINTIVNTGIQPKINVPETATPIAAAGKTAVQSPTPPAQSAVPDAAKLSQAVSKLNDYVQSVNRNLSFSVDKDSGQTVITITDSQTKEVIRQIPSEATLKLAASIDEQLHHFLVTEKV
jgi:flagellar protein FlaG